MKTRNTFYFDHDYNTRQDQKIMALVANYKMEGYGVFWSCIEIMATDTDGYLQAEAIPAIEASLSVAQGWLKPYLEWCVSMQLFKKCEHGNYYSERILEHKAYRQKLAINGQKGGKARVAQAGLKPGLSTRCILKESKGEESKVKEIKEKKKTTDMRYAPFLGIFLSVWKERRQGDYGISGKDGKQLKAFLSSAPNATEVEWRTVLDNCLADEFHAKNFSLYYCAAKYPILLNVKNGGVDGKREFEQNIDSKYDKL